MRLAASAGVFQSFGHVPCNLPPFFTDQLGDSTPDLVALEINYVAITPSDNGARKRTS